MRLAPDARVVISEFAAHRVHERSRYLRHQLLGNLPRKISIDTTIDVHSVSSSSSNTALSSTPALAREIRLFRSDRELTDSYRQRPSTWHQPPVRRHRRSKLHLRRCGRGAPATKLAVEERHHRPRARLLSTIRCGRRNGSPGAAEGGPSDIPTVKIKADEAAEQRRR